MRLAETHLGDHFFSFSPHFKSYILGPSPSSAIALQMRDLGAALSVIDLGPSGLGGTIWVGLSQMVLHIV